ncbi:hypothetical protein C8R47DRAFT_1211525 [Mycena vitilis]|nr:hypothetical protein C8R47DRAFT_1211525 [Mycena vitilis]
MSDNYATDYETHLGQLREHLSGNTGQPLPPSFIPPAGYWTSREKNCFFHALAVHSRLRPDLIANSVKTKSVVDVCAYIDALDRAATTRSPMPSLRSTLEGAMEVSDAWVEYEEAQASVLTKLDSEWEEEAEEHRRAALLTSRFQDEHAYWSWKEEQESQWRKQDTLAKLGIKHLQMLDRLIRNPAVTGPQIEPPLVTEPSASEPLAHSPEFRFVDKLVDPVPLALSSAPAETSLPPSSPRESATFDERPPDRSSILMTTHLPSSPVVTSRWPSSDASHRNLSPASRRRLAKRLHMRKKRAEAAGIEPNLLPTKLVPGPKQKRVYIRKPRPHKYKPRKPKNPPPELDMEEEGHSGPDMNAGPSVSGSRSVEDDDEGTVSDTTYYNKGGVTAPYKILSAFKEQGIDAHTLTEGGLNIFNLSMLGKLMRLFRGTFADSDEKSVASLISLDTVELLRNILLDFTSTTVHHAISLREQEVNLKRKIKVWRLDKEDEITAGNISDALKMQGFNHYSLLSDLSEDDATHPAPAYNETHHDHPDESLEQRFFEDESNFYARLPLHRELVPPVILLSNKEDAISFASPETEINEILAELDDEFELDELDHQLEARYEENLWQALTGG